MIEVSFPKRLAARVDETLAAGAYEAWTASDPAAECQSVNILLNADDSQELIDALQAAFGVGGDWRIVVLPVEAALPALAARTPGPAASAPREEIYQDVAAGAHISGDYLVLSALSTIVAAIGMNADNVAVVIGAMVIAPLLGPLLAFAFASALGDLDVMARSARTAGAGFAVGLGTAWLVSKFVDVNLDAHELLSRSEVGLDAVALALAAGAAAALSIVTRLSSALVGVMVAVALLPPSIAIGLFLGEGEAHLAAGAALLLATNVISVNIAAQVVFAAKGVHPRTWLEKRSAKRSRTINFAVWGGLLAALVFVLAVGFG